MSQYLEKAAEHLARAASQEIYDNAKAAQLQLDVAREYAKLAAIDRGLLPAGMDRDPAAAASGRAQTHA